MVQYELTGELIFLLPYFLMCRRRITLSQGRILLRLKSDSVIFSDPPAELLGSGEGQEPQAPTALHLTAVLFTG